MKFKDKDGAWRVEPIGEVALLAMNAEPSPYVLFDAEEARSGFRPTFLPLLVRGESMELVMYEDNIPKHGYIVVDGGHHRV